MEELTEMLTWYQLDLHKKPIGLLNIDGYYDYFLQWVRPVCPVLYYRLQNEKHKKHNDPLVFF